MRRSYDRPPTTINESLQDLIERTRSADLTFATQLLQMAQLEVLMSQQGVTPDEMDELRLAFERQADAGRVLDLGALRQSRQRAIRTR